MPWICVFHRELNCTCCLYWCTGRCVSLPHLYNPTSGQVGIPWSCSPNLLVCFSSVCITHFNITFFLLCLLLRIYRTMKDLRGFAECKVLWGSCNCLCFPTAESMHLYLHCSLFYSLVQQTASSWVRSSEQQRSCWALPHFGICPWARCRDEWTAA